MLRSTWNSGPNKNLGQVRRIGTEFKNGDKDAGPMAQFEEVFPEYGVYKLLLENLNEGIVIVNKRMRIQYVNRVFSRMADYGRDKLLGSHLSEFMRPSGVLSLSLLLRRALKGDCRQKVDFYDGKGRILYLQVSLCVFQSNRQILFGITVTDVSSGHQKLGTSEESEELRLKDEELQKANEDLKSLGFIASHHLQEPLRKIQTFVNLIISSAPILTPKVSDYFSKVVNAAHRMQMLIEDLVTYCNTRSGDFVLIETDLDKMLHEILQKYTCRNDREITAEITGHLPVLKVIPFQLKLLFQHLLNNSVKFCPCEKKLELKIQCVVENGSAELGLDVARKYHRLSFSDNGIGFDNKYGNRIFEIFQKLHRAEEYEGTGIGLALCKRVAQNHHGTIVATAEKGCGARFDLFLPVNAD
jgi:PAS domain S-box-containing protein